MKKQALAIIVREHKRYMKLARKTPKSDPQRMLYYTSAQTCHNLAVLIENGVIEHE